MSTKTIPAQVIKTCDCCESVMDHRNARQDAKLTLKFDVLDMQGSACAQGGSTLDLCDSCLHSIREAINTSCRAIRTERNDNSAQSKYDGEAP